MPESTLPEISFLDKSGRFVVPTALRKQMGWATGDKLTLAVVDNELRVVSVRQAIVAAQEMVAARVPAGFNLADEWVRERRAETARDNDTLDSATTNSVRQHLEVARG